MSNKKRLFQSLIIASMLLLNHANFASVIASSLVYQLPYLHEPITIQIDSGNIAVNLDDTKDYIIELGGVDRTITMLDINPTDRITIDGGRRILIVGGKIINQKHAGSSLLFRNMPKDSLIFIEGVEFIMDNPTGADAINVMGKEWHSPKALIIQNCKFTGINGLSNAIHGDGIQFTDWKTTNREGKLARGNLYVTNCDFDTSYQGVICSKHSYMTTYDSLPFDNYVNVPTSYNYFENIFFESNEISTVEPLKLRYIFWGVGSQTGKNKTDLYNVEFEKYHDTNIQPTARLIHPRILATYVASPMSLQIEDTVTPNRKLINDGTVAQIKVYNYSGSSANSFIQGTPGETYDPLQTTQRSKPAPMVFSYMGMHNRTLSGGTDTVIYDADDLIERFFLKYDNALESAGDHINFQLNGVEAGNYNIELHYLKGPDSGTFYIEKDNTVLHTFYSNANSKTVKSQTIYNINFSTGDHEITFRKKYNSANLGLYLHKIELIKN